MNLLYMFLSILSFGFIHKNFEGNNVYISPDDEEPSSGNKIKMKLQEFQRRYRLCSETEDILNLLLLNDISTSNFSLLFYCSAASFTAIDKNYLTPFFTSQNGDEEDEGKFNLA